jgi:hypothetical protein
VRLPGGRANPIDCAPRPRYGYPVERKGEVSESMIFGIGLFRTGNESLTRALCMMGLNAVHWPADMLPRWDRFEIHPLPDVDAIIEGPFVRWHLYAARKWPDAKLIVTTRNKTEWLDSCEAWWAKVPPEGSSWWRRRILWMGTCVFDRELFSAMWDQHYASVRSIQRDPSGRSIPEGSNLLEIDVCSSSSSGLLWDQLATFLDRPAPRDQPFPHLNRREER